MNKEKALEIAQDMPCIMNHITDYAYWTWDEVFQFANEIARIEREECAKIVEMQTEQECIDPFCCVDELTVAASLIRNKA